MPKDTEVNYAHKNFNIPPKRKYRTHNWTRDLCLGQNKPDDVQRARQDFYRGVEKQRKTSSKRIYWE